MVLKPKKPTFKQLIAKVHQCEDVVEAREREVVDDVRQLKASWLAAWTPGRIIVAGLASGFVIGRAEPIRALGKSGGLMHIVSLVSSLVAGGSAKVAADQATEAKEEVAEGKIAAGAAVDPGMAAAVASVHPDAVADDLDDETFALAQAEARARAARTATVDQVAP